MKYQPEKYEFERGDIIASLDYDAVGVKTNRGWKFSNGSHEINNNHEDRHAEYLLGKHTWVYLGNRFKGLTSRHLGDRV